MSGNTTIARADTSDAGEILGLIRRAFAAVAERYGDPALPPLVEPLEEHRALYATHIVLKATDEHGAIIGTVQGELRPDGTCYVSRLAVEPALQGRGIGRSLTRELEAECPTARRLELFTGHRCNASLALYTSLGYREIRRERASELLTLVWLEKMR